MSVSSPSVVQATFAATLVDEWIAQGLSDVIICPGSRSTPLALAFYGRTEMTCHVRIDERSAAFFAIGVALRSKRPVAILVTSGTAAAELHAAVAEADQAAVPLIVITADRPPELHGVGAAQTIEQGHLFGGMVRAFADPGAASLASRVTWRGLAQSLWASATAIWPGPVHLNAAFVEPLVGVPEALPAVVTDLEPAERHPVLEPPVDLRGKKVLMILGPGAPVGSIESAHHYGWVVFGDATAQGSTPFADPLLRSDAFAALAKPDLVLRVGGLPASKFVAQRLREWGVPVIGVTDGGPIADPDRVITQRWGTSWTREEHEWWGDPNYRELVQRASEVVGEEIAAEELGGRFTEILLARRVVKASTDLGVPLVIGSSMPIRDCEWWAPAREVATFSNRGVNGIDGVVSTVFGVGATAAAIGFVGDVTFLHDVSALTHGVGEHGGTAVLVVSDNRGGGIFSFLAQGESVDPASFDALFTTSHTHDLAAIARSFGHHAVDVTSESELTTAIEEGVAREGVSVVVARVHSPRDNVLSHAHLVERIVSRLETFA